jgi:hypothetical protein
VPLGPVWSVLGSSPVLQVVFRLVSAYSLSQNTIESAETSRLFHQPNQPSGTSGPGFPLLIQFFSVPFPCSIAVRRFYTKFGSTTRTSILVDGKAKKTMYLERLVIVVGRRSN